MMIKEAATIVGTLVGAGVLSASPAGADYDSYIASLESAGLLIYERPPDCIDRPQMDSLCPVQDQFYSQDEAARIGEWVCDNIRDGESRAWIIESITFGEGPKYTDHAAGAIYDIARTEYCW